MQIIFLWFIFYAGGRCGELPQRPRKSSVACARPIVAVYEMLPLRCDKYPEVILDDPPDHAVLLRDVMKTAEIMTFFLQ